MSQEKTSEKYRVREWLEEQYVTKNKTIKKIAEEFGYSESTLSRYKSRFGLSKNNKKVSKANYTNYNWLYNQYIEQNKTAVEIAESCGVNRGTIFDYLYKFNFRKEDEDKSTAYKSRVKKLSLKKYKVKHFNLSESVKRKREVTNLKKYSSRTYLGSKAHHENSETIVVCEKSLCQWASKIGISNIILYRWIYKNPNYTEQQFLEYVANYSSKITNIENIFSQTIDLPLYNKAFDCLSYPHLKYRPDFKLTPYSAANVDGLYWHSSAHKSDAKYHFEMRKEYEDLGLRIFQFTEDQINYKMNIVKSVVNNHLGHSARIFARKTEIVSLSQSEANDFLESTHLMGTIKSKHIGLTYQNELVMVFSYKMIGDDLKVERVSTKLDHLVVGGFSKLLKYCIKKLAPKRVNYWVDLRYGTGCHLKNYGFVHQRDTLGWKWTDFNKTYNRLRCRANMDSRKLSERAYAEELSWFKIYDAGQRLYTLEIK